MKEIDLNLLKIYNDILIDYRNNNIFTESINKYKDISITNINLKHNNKDINKPKGNYITISFKDITDESNYKKVLKVFISELSNLINKQNLNKHYKVLTIGLGNINSTPDSLGPKTNNQIITTRHIYELIGKRNIKHSLSKINPDVMANTGIESYDIIRSITKIIDIDLIILIDALSTNDINNLNKTIQLTDTYVNPGSGINNNRKIITNKNLNKKIIVIGVPTVLNQDKTIVTTKDIDYQIDKFSKLISNGINKVIHNK